MNRSTKNHYETIANLGCVLCLHLGYRGTPCEIHHIRRYGTKRDAAPVIGLCPEHHRGNTGVHGMGKKAFARHYKVSEEDLLELTNSILGKENHYEPERSEPY